MKAIFDVARAGTIFQCLVQHFPSLMMKLLFRMMPKKVFKEHAKHNAMAADKLKRRMQIGEQRPDLVEGLLKRRDEWVCRIMIA